MDRFERLPLMAKNFNDFNLHSNMDRFESCYRDDFDDVFLHLHSNMDRFERNGVPPRCPLSDHIYIPIWIDLKDRPQSQT